MSNPKDILSDSIFQGLDRFATRVFKIAVVSYIVYSVVMLSLGHYDRDDTDGVERSGVKLVTDYGTGCQYLETVKGGITPRLNGYGEHEGCIK